MATPSLARGGHRTPYILRSNMLGQRGGFYAVRFLPFLFTTLCHHLFTCSLCLQSDSLQSEQVKKWLLRLNFSLLKK